MSLKGNGEVFSMLKEVSENRMPEHPEDILLAFEDFEILMMRAEPDRKSVV